MPRVPFFSLPAVVLVLVACSGGPAASSTPAGPATTPTAAPTAAATAPANGGATPGCDPAYGCDPGPTAPPEDDASVNLSVDGTYLVASNGMALYVFDNDSPGTTACTSDTCMGAWPALLAGAEPAPVAGDGVSGDLTAFERPDGDFQVQYNGRPLYFFTGDSAPGDKNGDGVNGVWHLAVP
jgi:predicted lipoprotein with Yx(FWY)xxD motif